MKKVGYVVLAGIALFFAYQFYDRQFKLGNIGANWTPVETPVVSDREQSELQGIFGQPFAYLDRGKQSYVFVSRDGKYVIKFFDTRCLRSGGFPLLFPIDEEHCRKKLRKMVKGFQTAAAYDRGHNGIVYMQLAPNPAFHQKVDLTDRFGIAHTIDLASVPFVLQHKAIPLRELISTLLDKGEVGEANKRIGQIIEMYVDGYRRGVYDRDHNFMYNTGFIGEDPIRIDVGRLQYSEEIKEANVYMNDLRKLAVGRLGEWLQRHYPQYRDQMLDASNKKLEEVSKSN